MMRRRPPTQGRAGPDEMLTQIGEVPPRYWATYTERAKLDFVASRMLAKDRRDRRVTSHNEMKAEGYLSSSQLYNRVRREVYSETGDLSLLHRSGSSGVFSRPYRRPRITKTGSSDS